MILVEPQLSFLPTDSRSFSVGMFLTVKFGLSKAPSVAESAFQLHFNSISFARLSWHAFNNVSFASPKDVLFIPLSLECLGHGSSWFDGGSSVIRQNDRNLVFLQATSTRNHHILFTSFTPSMANHLITQKQISQLHGQTTLPLLITLRGSFGPRSARVNLTETGNLVLFDENGTTVGQSFNHPTDALVPGQSSVIGNHLTASVSNTNWTYGLYSLSITSERPFACDSLGQDWKYRWKIIFDIARGLAYLHEDFKQKIIHVDIKPQNILLDESFSAEVFDFGLSKLIDRDQSQVMTALRGTPGYLAPEWLNLISFGVMVLEMVYGRKSLDRYRPEESMHLLSLFKQKSEEDRLMDIADKHN
ncbi:Protein kinase domain [Dillenia turbinata]|uniref:non-specific serine/threonine protein kinase n=1 Tax=Dillenia turbinata TaxID=194707 RepID=A0AAN8Z0D0_9MAGN